MSIQQFILCSTTLSYVDIKIFPDVMSCGQRNVRGLLFFFSYMFIKLTRSWYVCILIFTFHNLLSCNSATYMYYPLIFESRDRHGGQKTYKISRWRDTVGLNLGAFEGQMISISIEVPNFEFVLHNWTWMLHDNLGPSLSRRLFAVSPRNDHIKPSEEKGTSSGP